MDHMECHHRWQTQEGGAKFTWPQVYLRSFLRSDPQCSYIHKNLRREDRRRSPLPLPRWDMCKKERQAIQEPEKPGKLHTQNPMIGKDNQTINFSLIIWMNFQTGSDYPIEIWQVSNHNFSPAVRINFQTESDHPIAIRLSVKSQFFPDCLDEFPN